MSFSDNYFELRKKKKKEDPEKADIAPLYTNKTTAFFHKDPDLAPVISTPKTTTKAKTKDDEDERKWFQKGAFEDGYQFGDVTKTILGSVSDIGENLGAGIIGMGEKVVDTLAYVAPYVAQGQFYQNGGAYLPLEVQKVNQEVFDAAKKGNAEFIKKDLYDEEKVAKALLSLSPANLALKMGGTNAEDASVFGEKTDSLVQSGGQLLATAGLQAVGVPWFVTSGVTSFGGELENALNEDASMEEAGLSAAITAGAEILTEKISGGIKFGGGTLDDALTKKIARGVSSKVVRTLSKLGLDMVGEGAEEVLSGTMSAIGQKITYADDAELSELFTSEEALESFIGGAVLGGVGGSVQAIKAGTKGVDYASGLTTNEKAVVDKVYKDLVAEAEKNGKVTEKQKSKIYDEVLEQMEKGYISTDTIEEVLGGESYTTYKSTIDNEQALQQEFDTLNKMKQGEMTGEQIDRRAELKQQLADLENNSQRDALKSKLSNEVFGLVKGDRLSESYNQEAMRGQAFDADLTKYETKQQETIKKAVESGVLNNTRRTHEFVDMIAKISADKGVLFDFTNNQKLKESGFAVDGVVRNGFVDGEGKITLNTQSAKYLNSVVGHEITHVLEGTDLYQVLQDTVFEYAKTKGEYDSRLQAITELYKKHDPDADPMKELTADLVGDYLFMDSDFINNLSTNHRNVFQKVYDEIKYLCKVATAGSKEARDLEKVKKAFEDAYRADSKAQGVTKYSISETTDGRFAAVVDNDILSNIDTSNWDKSKKDTAKKAASDALKQFKDGIVVDGITRKVNKVSRREYTRSNYTESLYKNSPDIFADKMRVADIADDIVVAATNWNRDGGLKHQRSDRFVDFDHGETLIVSGNSKYSAEVVIGITDTGEAVLYDVVDMTPITFDIKKEESPTTATTQNAIGDIQGDSSAANVAQKVVGVNGKFSLSDSDGKQLSKEQQDYFKDSKMRDDNGNLMVMYHGSQDAGFHTFDSQMSDDGTSFFFVDRNDVAASYSGTTETYEAKTIRTPEDMNNFLAEIGYDHYEAVERNGKYELLENNEHIATKDTMQEIYEEFCWYEGVGEGDANYKVYLNLKNPLVVDAGGRNWNNISREYSQEVADRYHSLTDEEKTALSDVAEWGEYSIFRDELLTVAKAASEGKLDDHSKILASAYDKLGGANANLFDAFSIAGDNFSEESIKQFAAKQMNTRDYAKKAKNEGYDGVIFKNIHDNGGYSNGSEGASTVAIAFDSNQIKSTANQKPTADPDIRYSLTEYTDEEKKAHNKAVADHFGITYRWAETGYVLLDGSRLDLSGKHEGAPGGYRTVDHRDIVDALGSDYGDDTYSGSLVQFMSEGNIRISPESNGINLSVKPNKAQEMALSSFVSNARGEVMLDIDDQNGYTVVSVEYPRGTHANKVLNDIRGWFDNGTKPKVLNTSPFRYSLSDKGEEQKKYGNYAVSGKDIALKTAPEAVEQPVQEEIAPSNDVAPVKETVSKTETQAPSAVLYHRRDGENGWGDVYGTAQEALNDAVQHVNPELWDAFGKEFENSVGTKNAVTPITTALIAVQEDVRQETITPIQGAQLLSEAYNHGGADTLKRLYNPKTGNLYNQYLEKAKQYETVAPVGVNDLFPDDLAPIDAELDRLIQEKESLENRMLNMADTEDLSEFDAVMERYSAVISRIEELEAEVKETDTDRIDSLSDADAPPEMEAPYPGDPSNAPVENPFDDRNWNKVGNQKVKAYMYENPEVKPFFQDEAMTLMGELNDTQKGERYYSAEAFNRTGNEDAWTGVKRFTSDSIAEMLDSWGLSYADIEKGLKAIIEDNGAENIAAAKKIEFMLNDRLLNGYKDFYTNRYTEPNQDYINLLKEKQINEYSEEAFAKFMETADQYAPDDIAPAAVVAEENTDTQDVAPVAEKYEAIKPKREPSAEPKLIRVDNGDSNPKGKQRKWVRTSTNSEAVDRKVLPKDLDQDLIHYQPISNKKTLGNANAKLDRMGYEHSVAYFESQFDSNKVTLDDIALGERLIQEAVKNGDTKTAGDLIMDISILGTELGQKVQALSIIKRLTPEGQLRMLQRTVQRGKTKGDKSYDDVTITQDMIDKILSAYGKDGSYDQAYLNEMVEDVKQQIADQMKVTAMDKVNAWRYLSMLGNPKTHIRNLVSNVAMRGTVAVKNVVARTIETIAPVENRTKTFRTASQEVKAFAERKAIEMKDDLMDGGKYSEDATIKQKREVFKTKILNGVYEFNSDMLSKEDWWFSKPAFQSALSEFLTANGIRTEQDIKSNPKITAKAIQYATEQSQIATFRQYSWLANKINEIERKNAATNIAVGSILPFKKTPINIAKTGLSYSPLGFAKTLTYDAVQVKKGNMEASELIDHLAQNITGTALTLVGYMLASSGFLNGAGDDDKEGDYDYQLGKQAYSVNIGDATFSLSWLSPVAMPLFVGANAYEQLVEGKEWNGDVVVETLAQTLDPLSEMSFISSLDSVLSSYDSGFEKFAGIGETMAQNYITQFVPTLSSQIATVMDDKKRTTKVAADSDFKFFDKTINNLMYKIPGLRQLLEPTTDIWGNEVKQSENVLERAFETFLAPYARREDIATDVDEEIKYLYRQTGDSGVIPSIPYNYINYDDVKYEMSAAEFTTFKKQYGQTALDLMEQLFDTETYQNADSETRADMVNRVYDYARDEAKKSYFVNHGVDFTNATEDGKEVYKKDPIKGAIEADLSVDEYVFSIDYPEKYSFFKENGISYDTYASADEDGKRAYSWAFENPGKYTMSKAISDDFMTYYQYKSDCNDFDAKDENGETVSGLKKERVLDYINNLDIDYGQKIILFRSMYDSKEDRANYNAEIVDYLNSRADISYEEMETILKELGFTVYSDGRITWD